MTFQYISGQLPIFSGAVRSGDLVTTSGVVSDTVIGEPDTDLTFEREATEVVERLRQILEEAGAELSHVMRVDAYLADAQLAAEWNEVFVRYWDTPRPARCTTVTQFAIPGVRIELSVIASLA